jgi:hypothetical protein
MSGSLPPRISDAANPVKPVSRDGAVCAKAGTALAQSHTKSIAFVRNFTSRAKPKAASYRAIFMSASGLA